MTKQFSNNIHWFFIGALLLIIYFVGLSLYTKFVPPSSSIPAYSATAEAKEVIKPQETVVKLRVTEKGKTTSLAIQKSNSVVNDITTSLQTLGIDKKDIKTSDYQIYGTYEGDSNTPIGQEVWVILEVTVKDIERVKNVTETAFTAGATALEQTTYRNDKQKNEAEEKAREKAFTEAKKKAEKFAKFAGKKLGKLTYVSDYITTPATTTPTENTTPQSAEIEVTVSVNLTYELN